MVTGLYRPRRVSSDYWRLDDVALTGSSTASGFTTYGPLAVASGAFAGPLTANAGSWLAQPQTASVPADRLSTVAGNVTALQQTLANAVKLPDLDVVTSLPAVLNGTASNLDVARSLLDICAVLLFLLAAAALLAVARLLAGQREGETAMLAARGATRWQLIRLTATEAVPLCLLCSAAGGVLGVLLARALSGAGGPGAGSAAGRGTPLAGVFWAGAAVAAGAVIIMVLPSLGPLTPGTARVRRGRRARSAELLDLLGLADCLHHRPDQMSGGEQQRAAIAVALVNEPKVLLADEPTGELDTATAAEVFSALQTANAELGVTVLIVTHDPAVSSVVRRTVAIRDGRTSTETHRHATTSDDGEVAHHAVEYAVLDRAGRLQLPREMTEPLGMRDLVRLEAEPDHIGVWPDERDAGEST